MCRQTFIVDVPKNMSSKTVAEIFSAYRMGDVAFLNADRSHGPFNSDQDQDQHRDCWQLDQSNDLWVTVDKKQGTAEIRCRYPHEEQIIEAMAVLFNASYNN